VLTVPAVQVDVLHVLWGNTQLQWAQLQALLVSIVLLENTLNLHQLECISALIVFPAATAQEMVRTFNPALRDFIHVSPRRSPRLCVLFVRRGLTLFSVVLCAYRVHLVIIARVQWQCSRVLPVRIL
jgi:hypothetical protein